MSLLSPQLQAFIAIAKLKTVHAAAKAIHITQTAVTQRIHSLESKLGTTLFTRTRRGMFLTPEGEALLRYCLAAQELEGEALANIHGAGADTEIRINITGPSSIMHSRIIPLCFPVMQQFPNLLMQFDINDNDARVRLLRSGECQLAIIRPEDVAPEMEHKILKPERYFLVCTSAWKKRKLADIISSERIIDFDPDDEMTFNYLRHFDLFDLVKHDRHFANRTDALAMMLVEGYGFGLLTEEFSEPYLKKNQLIVLNSGKIYENNLALAWYTRYEPPKYFSTLIKAIK